MTRQATHHNRAVDSAFQLIDILASSEKGLRLTDVVARSGLPKTSVHRILWTLASIDVVHHDKSAGTYHLGSKLARTAANAQNIKAVEPPPRIPAVTAPAMPVQASDRVRHQRDFSAPVLDRNGNPVARLTMSVRAFALPEQAAQRFANLVQDTAEQIAEQVSGRPRESALYSS